MTAVTHRLTCRLVHLRHCQTIRTIVAPCQAAVNAETRIPNSILRAAGDPGGRQTLAVLVTALRFSSQIMFGPCFVPMLRIHPRHRHQYTWTQSKEQSFVETLLTDTEQGIQTSRVQTAKRKSVHGSKTALELSKEHHPVLQTRRPTTSETKRFYRGQHSAIPARRCWKSLPWRDCPPNGHFPTPGRLHATRALPATCRGLREDLLDLRNQMMTLGSVPRAQSSGNTCVCREIQQANATGASTVWGLRP